MHVRDLVVSFLIAVIATAPAMALEIAPTVHPDGIEVQAEGQETAGTGELDPTAATTDDVDLEGGMPLQDGNPDEDAQDSDSDEPVPPNRLEGPALHRSETDASRPLETIGGAEPDLPSPRTHDSERVAETTRSSRGPEAVHQVELRTERRAGLGALPPPHGTALSPQR